MKGIRDKNVTGSYHKVHDIEFVFVIGLHHDAVQFGNNWMKKFRGQPKLDEANRIQYNTIQYNTIQ